MLDVVIIGSGPAGLSAAIYAKRANLDAVVLEKEYLGTGQIAYSSRVDNYPGLPGKDGYSLGEAFLEHAEGLGVTIEEAEVTAITKKEQRFVISCEDGKNIEAKTVVYAAGCQNRRLGVPGEEKLLAKGVSFCAVCDGAFYKGKKAAVIGGGDTALDDAIVFIRYLRTGISHSPESRIPWSREDKKEIRRAFQCNDTYQYESTENHRGR